MGFFDLFKKANYSQNVSATMNAANQNNTSTPSTFTVVDPNTSVNVADAAPAAPTTEANNANASQASAAGTASTGNNQTTVVSFATGSPIDIIYAYLNKNYEEKGYADAMINSDLAFKEMNMKLIKNRILVVFDEANLKYDAEMADIDTRIDICSAAGLVATSAQLQRKKTVILQHKEELARLENDFRNKTNEAFIPLQSYECGFLRGVAAIALGGPRVTAQSSSSSAPVLSFIDTKIA